MLNLSHKRTTQANGENGVRINIPKFLAQTFEVDDPGEEVFLGQAEIDGIPIIALTNKKYKRELDEIHERAQKRKRDDYL